MKGKSLNISWFISQTSFLLSYVVWGVGALLTLPSPEALGQDNLQNELARIKVNLQGPLEQENFAALLTNPQQGLCPQERGEICLEGLCAKSGPEEQSMRIFGHRGGSYSAPENTRASILEAFALQAQGVEFDIQMTQDNQIIILHDETLERTAGPYDPQLFPHLSQQEYTQLLQTPVQKLNFHDIQQVDIGEWKDARWKGEKVITLSEALQILPKGKEYLVEVKGDDFAIIPHLKKVLRESQVDPSSIKLIGFGLEVMREIKKELPEFQSFYILEHFQVDTPEKMEGEIQKALAANLDGLDFEGQPNITREVVQRIKKEGKQVIVWVPGAHGPLDSVENLDFMADSGVDIFTSNLPPEVVQWGQNSR